MTDLNINTKEVCRYEIMLDYYKAQVKVNNKINKSKH